jgi:hypothetical protein
VRDRGASLSKGQVRTRLIIVASVRVQNPAEMRLAQNDDVIQTLTPDRSDQPFGNAVVKSSQLHSYRLIGRKPSWLRMSFTPSTDVSSGS